MQTASPPVPGILSQTAAVSAGAVVARCVSVVRGVALARLLDPTGYGQLNGLLLVAEYGDRSHLGTLNAMGRNAPISIGAGDLEEAEAIAGAALFVTLCTSTIVTVGILIAAILSPWPMKQRIALALMGPVVFCSQLHLFQNILARTRLRMHLMSGLRMWNAVAQLVFAVGCGFLWGLPGVVGGVAIGTLLTVILGNRRLGGYPRIKTDWARVKGLLRIGLPLVWITSMYTVLESLGRIAVLRWLGTAQLGQFAIALVAVSVMAFIPSAVGQVLSPRIMRAYGRKETQGVEFLLREPILLLGLLLPIVGGIGAVAMPWAVATFLPRFEAAIVPGQILLLNFTPYALRAFSSEVLVASSRLYRIALLQSLGIVLLAGLVAISLTMGWGIVGVAGSTAIVYWAYGVSMMAAALRVRRKQPGEIARFVSSALIPTVWIAFVCVFLRLAAASLDKNVASLGWSMVSVLTIALASSPLLWFAIQRLKLLRRAQSQ